MKQYTLDKNGNASSVTQGNWGGGTLRQTTNMYLFYTPDAATSPVISESNAYWNSASPRVRWPVKSTQVSGTGTGSYAEYSYDGAGNVQTEM